MIACRLSLLQCIDLIYQCVYIIAMMSLNSDQLDAFEAVARLKSFTTAAMELHLTQPALSRRIQSLERDLNTSLLLRKPSGIELTTAGGRLLRFIETKRLLENELKSDLDQSESKEPMGVVRIAGYTSILHNMVTPAIASFLRKHPHVGIHYLATQDVRPHERQADMLLKAETDLLLTISDFSNRDLISHFLGDQQLVAVESTRYTGRSDVYLDTRPEDQTTVEFFNKQKVKQPHYERSYLYDEEGILKGVMQGLGRAVVFRSLIKKTMALRQVPDCNPMTWPMYLVYRKQTHYLPAMDAIRRAILASSGTLLN